MLGRGFIAVSLVFAAACGSPQRKPWPAADDPSRCDPAQRILVQDVDNARDLGGVPLLVGGSTACNTLFRGPPLAPATATLCTGVSELGIRSVIDLRTAEESATVPEAACVADAARIVNAPLPIPYNVSGDDYIADLDASESMALAFATLGDESAYPVYFHCTWGRDRTGLLAALALAAAGAGRTAILDEYELSSWTVGAYPQSLRAALDEVERRGGIETYLTQLGVTAEQLSVLRRRLVASP